MVKVLTHGGQDLKSVQRHLAYLNRKGELDIETDEGERIVGKGVEKELLEDWDLDLEEDRRRVDLGPLKDREFARHLRAHGVEANATERAVRGNRLPAKFDGIYRAERRGESRHTRTHTAAVARELLKGDGEPRGLRKFTHEALGHERFRSIDLVENHGLDLTGGFHSDEWGDFRTYFRFQLSSTGKIKRLDIGQAK